MDVAVVVRAGWSRVGGHGILQAVELAKTVKSCICASSDRDLYYVDSLP